MFLQLHNFMHLAIDGLQPCLLTILTWSIDQEIQILIRMLFPTDSSVMCNMTSVIPFILTIPVSKEVININHSSLHSECWQSTDTVQEQIQEPNIAYWFNHVNNKNKPNKGNIPPNSYRNYLYQCFGKLRINEWLVFQRFNNEYSHYTSTCFTSDTY